MALLDNVNPEMLLALGAGLLEGEQPGRSLGYGLGRAAQYLSPLAATQTAEMKKIAERERIRGLISPMLGQQARTIESPAFIAGESQQPATGMYATQPQLAGLLDAYSQVDPTATLGLLSKQMMTPPIAGKDRFMEVDGRLFDVVNQSVVDIPGLSPKEEKEVFNREKELRGEFTKVTADFAKQNDAYGRIKASAADPSPAGDLALIFNYMKLLDPGSTVREGEFANAQNSAGVPERVRAYYNNVMRGERLTETTRADFMDRSNRLYTEAASGYDKRASTYRGLAKEYGLTPERVVYPRQLYTDIPPPGFTEAVK